MWRLFSEAAVRAGSAPGWIPAPDSPLDRAGPVPAGSAPCGGHRTDETPVPVGRQGASEITCGCARWSPRGGVFTIPAATGPDEAALMPAEHGHSRSPVVTDDDLDDVIGVVHWSDPLRAQGGLRDLVRVLRCCCPIPASYRSPACRPPGLRCIGARPAAGRIEPAESVVRRMVEPLQREGVGPAVHACTARPCRTGTICCGIQGSALLNQSF